MRSKTPEVKRHLFWVSLIALFAMTSRAQQDSLTAEQTAAPPIKITGFVDAYFCYDFNDPNNHEVSAPFLYNYKRHNEFNINLGLLSGSYSNDHIRGKIGLMSGTYAQYNYAAEQELLKHVYEANAGIRIMKHLWADAGIFASHIGNESAFSIQNPTLTRSIIAENSPYYLTGAKLTYDAGKKWLFSVLILNGWQNIQETPNNSNKPVCTQITFRPTKKIELNSSTFIGNEKPDTARQMRYFHHFYITTHFTEKLYMSASFDYGIQQKYRDKNKYNNWYGSSVIFKYKFTRKFSSSLRGELYNDESQVIVTTNTPNGLNVYGTSLNIDFAPYEGTLIRLEGKTYFSRDRVFLTKHGTNDQCTLLTMSFAVNF
jgi:hypothetical protein